MQAADLRMADLSYAKLQKADLRFASLESVHLGRASLVGASLVFADLSNASLQSSDLQDADLEGADLTRSDLQWANLRNAKFGDALEDYPDVVIGSPNLKYTDFRNAGGLTAEMIRGCTNYQLAFYGPDMLKQLDLPPDHNEKLQKQMEAEQQQAKSAAIAPEMPK
jgi:uncharacterized protein YjbI with pentapeptide repeats